MNEILYTLLVTVTIYHADPKQTDDTPFITASNKTIDSLNPAKHRWIAVSRDLEKLGFTFGACVYIDASANHISVNLALYKNGSQLFYTSEDVDATKATTINATIELDSDDYVELYAKADVESSGTWNMNQDGTTANNRAFWFGYKLVGV